MANIRLTANERQFVNAMDNAAGSVGRLSAELNIRLARAMRETDALSNQFQRGFGRLGERISSVGQSLTSALTVPLGIASGFATKLYGDIDQLKRGLDSYSISLETVKKIAKLPGLGIEEAAQSSITFASVKFAADLSTKAVMEFGNALVRSGKGKEELAGIATAFAQMKGKGGVMAEEVNQIAERLPMIRDLMQQAFGTSDTEVLQKKGITADQFLEKIVQQMEKLPRVSGGFKTAWENALDSLKIGAYEAVNAADKLFNLTGALNSLSGIIDSAVEKFKQLSPEMQTAIFIIGGIAVAVGPVLTAIGFLTTTIIPAFLTGLATISAPILGIAAVVGIAMANIIRYWDNIKSVLVSTGIWDGVAAIFKWGLGLLNSIVGVFYSLFTADWEGFWKSLKTIVARLWNGLVEIIAIPFKALFEFQRMAANALGFKALSNGATTVLGWIDSVASNVKAKIPESTNYLNKLNDAFNKLGTGGKSTAGAGKGDGSDALKKLQEQRDILGKLNLKEISSIGEKEFSKLYGPKAQPTFFEGLIQSGERLKKEMPKIMSGLDMSEAGMTIEQEIRKNLTDKAKLALLEFNLVAADMFKNLQITLITDAAAGIGEAIGSALGGAGFNLGKVFQSILSTIGGFMIDLGRQMLIAGQAIDFAKKTFGKSPAGAIALMVGGGLIKGLASTLFSQTPKFAQGGMVMGQTLAVLGDNPSGREMALPWEKTGSFAQAIASNLGGGMGGTVIPDVKILGEDIYISFNRYKKRIGQP